jgi:GNAT superfamily N-acetyltransferase
VPELVFKRLGQEDVATVAGFEAEIARISFPDDPVTDLDFYAKKLRKATWDKKEEPLVGFVGGKIAAWAWIAPRQNFITGENYADLRSFYVAEEFRGGGVAFALMERCLEFCREHKLARIVGRTAWTNGAMRSVYDLYEFEPKHVVYERKV